MDLKETSNESEASLISDVNKLFQKKGVTIDPIKSRQYTAYLEK